MIVAIVEGKGDAEAVPVLVRRMAIAFGTYVDVRPHRVKRQRVVKPNEFEKVLEFAAMQPECCGILVILDSDDDCPVDLASDLAARAAVTVGHLPSSVVIANREFEAWILAGVEGIRGQRGVAISVDAPQNPDQIGSPKAVLDRLMARSYLETDDQAAFAERLDIDAASSRSRSFRKMRKEVARLLAACA